MRVDQLERPAAVVDPALVDLTVLVDVVVQHQVLLGEGLLVYHDVLRFYRHELTIASLAHPDKPPASHLCSPQRVTSVTKRRRRSKYGPPPTHTRPLWSAPWTM